MPPALGTVARASHSRLLQPCQAARSVAVSTQSHRLQRICDQDSKVRLLVTGGLGFPEAYMRCTSTDISTYYLLQAGMSICVYTQFRRYATHLRVYPDANTNPGTSSSATSSFEARASPASSPVGQGNSKKQPQCRPLPWKLTPDDGFCAYPRSHTAIAPPDDQFIDSHDGLPQRHKGCRHKTGSGIRRRQGELEAVQLPT